MKILSAEQIRQADAYTIKHEPVTSAGLMMRAAKACYGWICANGKENKNFLVFCGTGNNGGDGLALAGLMAHAEVAVIGYSEKRSPDFVHYFNQCKERGVKITEIGSAADLASVKTTGAIIVDCLFGTGLKRPADGLAADAIDLINRSGCEVISIDVPSGLPCDELPVARVAVVKAAHTLTFQCPKRSFMLPSSGKYCGKVHVLDIGLDQKFIASLPSKDHFIDRDEIKKRYRPREKFSHKGTFGHALIVAGSYGKAGASVLAAKACLRAGAGLVTIHMPKCNYTVVQAALPEAMAEVDEGEYHIIRAVKTEKYDVVGVGPGLGTHEDTQNMLKVLIQNSSVPLVLDADALNILSENKTWLPFLPADSILTPHPKEFERLAGKSSDDMERYRLQKNFSVKHGVFVVLKGAHTCTSTPSGEMYFNSTGNPGMATAGSGDVLTGIITSLVAQEYSSLDSAVFGVYLHGLAGDIASLKLSEETMIAGDIIECLGEGYKDLS